jgi:topoisomerase-4 subunit A
MLEMDLTRKFNPEEIIYIQKYDPELVISAVHFDGHKNWTMVKRFKVETTSLGQRFSFITDHKDSKLLLGTISPKPFVQYSMKIANKKLKGEVDLAEFIDVKGWKAIGNKLSNQKLTDLEEIEPKEPLPDKLQAGDSIEMDVTRQTKLF